jgi:hypothetical protein
VAVNVNVLPEVELLGAVTVTVYGGVKAVPIGDPFSVNTTAAMGAMSVTVTVAVPLPPGDNWLGAVNCKIVGGVESMLSVSDVVARFPA